MENENESPTEQQSGIIFSYYQDQWSQVRHHENRMSSASWQVITVTVAIVAAYSQIRNVDSFSWVLKCACGSVIFILGTVGVVSAILTSIAARCHIERARAARKKLIFLEDFAVINEGRFPSLHFLLAIICGVAASLGLLLIIDTFLMYGAAATSTK